MSIKSQIFNYLSGGKLRDLQETLIDRLWENPLSNDPEFELGANAELAIGEFTSGYISESALRSELAKIAAEAERSGAHIQVLHVTFGVSQDSQRPDLRYGSGSALSTQIAAYG